ncbi:MAG: hypothetical protein ABR585_03955 [Gemmatimonadaceae bacterium]
MAGQQADKLEQPRGMVIAELLMALLLLAVAVSSLAALMYSVSRRADEPEKVTCVGKSVVTSPKCVAEAAGGGASKLLRSGTDAVCSGKSGSAVRECRDSLLARGNHETVLVPRTDSASLAMIAKKEKKPTVRTDRGFIH